jgi:hypothetical protein
MSDDGFAIVVERRARKRVRPRLVRLLQIGDAAPRTKSNEQDARAQLEKLWLCD